MTVFAALFHVIKLNAEHEQHTWVTGFYWTLVVMSTLGFGDITFTSDIGRVFSMVVLMSGVVFLLVMLPFLFIRLFYAPWLEARLRMRAPRKVPAGTRDHVIIAEYDTVAAGLIERLVAEQIPYGVIEPDPVRAGQLVGDHIRVLSGENDNRLTYERAAAANARMLLANSEDTINTADRPERGRAVGARQAAYRLCRNRGVLRQRPGIGGRQRSDRRAQRPAACS